MGLGLQKTHRQNQKSFISVHLCRSIDLFLFLFFFYLLLRLSISVLISMAEPSKFGATLNSGYFSFLSISYFWEELELLFSAELKTNCLHLNMVYSKVRWNCASDELAHPVS